MGRPATKKTAGKEDAAAVLLDALRGAGADGLNAAKLRVGGRSPAASARREALAVLVTGGGVQTLGAAKTARYFLAAHVPTAATVAARLRALAAGAGVPALWRETEFRRKLPAHERALLGPALAHLEAARQVVPLRHGRSGFFVFAGPLRAWLDTEGAAVVSPPVPAAEISDEALLAAYARLVRESGGFPDVKIAGLRGALPPSAGGMLGARLIAFWREGRATLSLGDWSLADEPTRAAAVEMDGENYLLVRLEA